MRAMSLLLIVLVLSGCGPSRENQADLDDCHRAALREVPDPSDAASTNDFQKLCMETKGYHFSAVAYSCGRGDLYSDAACYIR